jgi:hypothetical protein
LLHYGDKMTSKLPQTTLGAGDMVDLTTHNVHDDVAGSGIIVETSWNKENPDWYTVLVAGELIHWPARQLSLVKDGKLG